MTTPLTATATALAGISRAYKINAVPAPPVYPYLVFSAVFTNPDSYTLDANYGVRWGRVTLQAFGRTLDSADAIHSEALDVLLDQSLNVTDWDCGPCGVGNGGLIGAVVRDPDDNGVVGITTSLVFAATKETP